MKATVRLTQNVTLEVEEQEEMMTLHKAIALASYPRTCSNCKESGKVFLTTNKDKEGNIYINACCSACGAKAKLGRYKSGGGYFWHRNFEVWKKSEPEV